jgi:GMP synthase (glutamine-hydrolysing)
MNRYIKFLLALFSINSHNSFALDNAAPTLYDDRILILDFGSQYSQLIARRIREIGVYCEIHSHTMTEAEIIAFKPRGIILSGGPNSAFECDAPRAPSCIFNLGCPILGICYGMQIMAIQLDGSVQSSLKREFGYASIHIQNQSTLFDTIEDHTLEVWMSHGDQVIALPNNFISLAQSNNTHIVAMADTQHHFYGIQFHPEVSHTQHGNLILKNFVTTICGCALLWRATSIIENHVRAIQEKVGCDKVLLAVSGGVDSSVAAALLHRAIGNQLHCVFVDNGLLRHGEAQQVFSIFEKLDIPITQVDASAHFLRALANITEPEEKRKIIGREFIQIFEQQAQKLGDIKWLAQGTIYSDVIESSQSISGKAQTIKSHHNVGGLPQHMNLLLIEPLRHLFKDEVRQLGLRLGLPYEILYRHPFPGPGLAIRILGAIQPSYLEMLRAADAIFIEELHAHDLYKKVSQAFAVFLPIKSVAVKGDARHYEHVVALRTVETVDFMTARWAHLPHDFLAHVAARILNEVPGVARVVYDISDKPPATIEWE